MTGNYRTSTPASAAHRRRMLAGLTVGLLSVSAAAVVAVKVGSAPEGAQVKTISAYSRSAGASANAGHTGHTGAQAKTPAVNYDAVGGATPAPTVAASAPPLDILANNCDNSKLQLHDGFQAGNRCVTTEFGEVGENAKNPTLIISSAPRRVRVGQAFQIKVSTRNLVRDRFLAAAQGGYYKESSLLNAESLQRGHFHTACRMLESNTLAPDPTPGSVFFKATEDKKGGSRPDVVTVDVPAGLPSRGLAECAAWAGDGSHRIPMMESVQAIPAFDTVRIWVR
ncbi:MAG TPA: hypothetical protein VLL08_20935 [Kineosporiaceae bacterium]|nr:hypothetical protein [Kineosporiaceae bacterium]